MNYLIILFGLLVMALSLYLILQPKAALQYAAARAGTLGLYVPAIAARVGMGLVLILYAEQSRFPQTLEILGYLMVAAGLMLALIGRHRFERMIKLATERFANMSRVSGLLGAILGLFLIYAVI